MSKEMTEEFMECERAEALAHDEKIRELEEQERIQNYEFERGDVKY